MLHYIIKRLGQTLIVIFVVTILAFGLVRLAPGNPAELMLPETASEAEVKAISPARSRSVQRWRQPS